ncbi:MAG: hypothetical protein ACPG1A_17400, partial [Halioglobus sp.]
MTLNRRSTLQLSQRTTTLYDTQKGFNLPSLGSLQGAWGVARKLVASYDGPAFRLRRASDDAEMDIEFGDDGFTDTSPIAGFCG